MEQHDHPPRIEIVAIVTLAAIPFLPALSRGFVSDDYIVLRQISEQPFWRFFWDNVTGPWMGVEFVQFWRPVSTLALQLQELVFGIRPTGYLSLQLMTHLASVALLWHLTAKLFPDTRWGPAVVASLFAVYPLNSNTVLWISSAHPVLATLFGLAALVVWVHARRHGNRKLSIGSLLLFCLSLGCYEGAIVLPGLALAIDLLLSRQGHGPFNVTALVVRQFPFLTVAATYLVVRYLVLGVFIGGYPGVGAPDAGIWPAILHVFPKWSILILPWFAWPRPAWIETAIGLLLIAATLFLLRDSRRRGDPLLFAIVWMVICVLPYGGASPVPANGRYYYLASAGIGFLLVAMAGLAPIRYKRRALAVTALTLASAFIVLQTANIRRLIQASEVAQSVRRSAIEVAASQAEGSLFLVGAPEMIVNARGVNCAQVFHWGLSDALTPPFTDRLIDSYQIPPAAGRHISPLLVRPDLGSVWRWSEGGFVRLPPVSPSLGGITVRNEAGSRHTIAYLGADQLEYRLKTLGKMGVMTTPAPRGEGWLEAPIPWSFVEAVEKLYEGNVYCWLEGLDSDGRVVATSGLIMLSAE